MINSPDSLPCPSCSGHNAPDSKFCRHCGQSLEAAAPAAATVAATTIEGAAPTGATPAENLAPVPTVATVAPETLVAAETGEERSSPGEIDARRARQLLERAQGLTERGDTAGAILACRQALALSPSVAGGQAMLGGLLERTGDLTHAIQAFEKAAQSAPESGAKRDVERLRDKMGVKPDAPIFHFDDAELFNDETVPAATVATVVTTPAVAATGTPAMEATSAAPIAEVAAAPASDATENAVAAPAVVTEVVTAEPQTPGIAVSGDAVAAVPAVAATVPPVRERRVASVPVRVERRINTSPSVVASNFPLSTPIGARVVAPLAASTPVVNPIAFADTDAAPQGWSALWARPSYFGRSLPLVAATVLSLGFLGWARGLADARNMANAPTAIAANNPDSSAPIAGAPPVANSNSNLPSLAPVGSANSQTANSQSGGFAISNQPATSAAAPGATAPNAPAPGAGVPRAGAAPRSAPGASTTRTTRTTQRSGRSPQTLPPAAIPAPGSASRATARGAGDLVLPSPVITTPEPAAPPTSVLPSGGTPALNPAGSSARGYVRITQGRVGSILPSRPSSSANNSERAAAAAARGGSTAQAIDGLTNAINANSGDAGFRFQQRAQLFLSQGDYARAADDFQSAITAYNDQINRGDQVASARAGLRASRSGLNLALAGGR